ncbi:efflux RND transporter periplasmic adaptor subunit [Halomicronema sp. CCY15110]|uniref:efflux RND transporter periplasmic adaptor subunit n=1 Tax=Halomicronema sp. CCY15110 TaxID=2767773 RepID=UPI00195119F3|nr:efflux RND transporter periplasmic adaptor subunit [Halomicronema sp. CCY15110]
MVSHPGTLPSATSTTDRPSLATAPPHRWRRYRWGLVPGAIALLIGGISLYRIVAPADSSSELTAALPVAALPVESVSEYTTQREYTGELVAGRSSSLGFERPGTVVAVLVDEGDRVVAGQPLARLDIRTLEAQRQQLAAQQAAAQAQLRELEAGPRQEDIATAQATVAEIEQQLALAKLQRDRRADLYARGAISREELDREVFNTSALENRRAQAQSQLNEQQAGTRIEQLDAQAAQVSQAAASLRQVAVDLDKSVLRAPFDGVVSARSVDEGVVVAGGQAVLSLVEAGPLEAKVGVPPAVADTLSEGEEVAITVGDRPYTATITALLPELDATSRTVTVVLQVAAADLTVGQTVRLSLTDTQPAEGIWLPTTALVPSDRGLWSVYVLAESAAESPADVYIVSRREVEVVHTEGDRALVRGTLQPGEQAITTGTHRLTPGQSVTWQP